MRDDPRGLARSTLGGSAEAHGEGKSFTASLRRGLLVVAIVGCAALALGVLGRPWRNSEGTVLDQSKPRPQDPEATLSGPPLPANLPLLPTTPDEFVTDAKRLADELVASFPDSPDALLLSGRVYYAFGDVAKANDCWQTCLERAPEFAEAWCSRGEAAWEHGQFVVAADCLEKAISYNPGLDQEKVFLLVDSLMNIGRAEEAVFVLQKAAEAGPLPPFGLCLLGNGYIDLEEHKKAIEPFQAALALDPHSANAHYGLARVFTRLGQPDKAREHRAQYAKLKSQELTRTRRSRPESRARDLADVRPLSGKCCLNAGKIYALHGDLDAAERLWLKAVALEPGNPTPRKLLEVLYQQQGRQKDAILIARGTPSEGG